MDPRRFGFVCYTARQVSVANPRTAVPEADAPSQRQLRLAEYFIHGRGRGHASRSTALLQALESTGYEVRIHSGGAALDLLAQLPGTIRPRPPLKRGGAAVFRLLARGSIDAGRFWREPPKLVIGDGDQGALVGARAAGIPALAVGHDVVFDRRVDLGLKGASTAITQALWSQRANALPTRIANRWVGVHFLPARSEDPRLTLARPDCFVDVAPSYDPKGPVVCYFRDRDGLALARALADAGREVWLFGTEGVDEPRLISKPFSKTEFQTALLGCSAVVGSAGSNLLAECVMLNKPILAVYAQGDAEQFLNATLLERSGVGLGVCREQALAAVPRFVDRVNHGGFSQVNVLEQLLPLSVVAKRLLQTWPER